MENELEITIEEEKTFDVELETNTIEVVTSDYEKLNNLPKIHNIELIGNKELEELGLEELSNSELEEILK